MRIVLFLLAFLLPATAMAAQSTAGYNHIFGQVMCHSQLPCTGDDDLTTKAVAAASSCVSQHFHVDGASAYDITTTIDGNNCLTAARNSKNSFMPNCCIVPTQSNPNMCDLQCQLLSK